MIQIHLNKVLSLESQETCGWYIKVLSLHTRSCKFDFPTKYEDSTTYSMLTKSRKEYLILTK